MYLMKTYREWCEDMLIDTETGEKYGDWVYSRYYLAGVEVTRKEFNAKDPSRKDWKTEVILRK